MQRVQPLTKKQFLYFVFYESHVTRAVNSTQNISMIFFIFLERSV